jgi:hypothetical protein
MWYRGCRFREDILGTRARRVVAEDEPREIATVFDWGITTILR